MSRFLVFILLVLLQHLSFSQLLQQNSYPKNYFGWPTSLPPDIVANLGELRTNHWHMGLDVRTAQVVNKPVVASADGYIAFVGIEPLSWGRWIIINHPNGYATLYGHLNTFRADLEQYVKDHQYETESWETHLNIPPGKFVVKKGDFISYSGTTGGSQGPHIHWEIIDQKTSKRLNPTLFGTPIRDNVPPTVLRIAMYDRNNSTFDQYPRIFKLSKSNNIYTVAGGVIETNFNRTSFAIQAYDTRNGTSNQDGIYSAQVFVDGREISGFYLDNISYDATRYMNAHVDYKMKADGGAWMQHTAKLPGDASGIYYDFGQNGLINLYDTLQHDIKIVVKDADGNSTTVQFALKNTGEAPPLTRQYEWQPNQLNKLFKYDFEAYLFPNILYDKMNSGYQRLAGSGGTSVSGAHKLGAHNLPAQDYYEIRIKPDKPISFEQKNLVVIRLKSKRNYYKKAEWKDEWITARFRDFGVFEAFIDNSPPVINNLGSSEVVDLTKASRIVFTPTDNFGIKEFKVTVDGKWLRFTNDKGHNYIYNFDEKITPGEHTLTATATDIAGNKTTRTWRFKRGTTVRANYGANNDEADLMNRLDENDDNIDMPANKSIRKKPVEEAPVKKAAAKKPATTLAAKTNTKTKTTKSNVKEAAKKKTEVKKTTVNKGKPAANKKTKKP